MTQVSVNSAGSAGSVESADPAEVADPPEAAGPAEAVKVAEAPATPAPAAPPTIGGLTVPVGPIERVMSWVIRKLSWSRLSHPRVAMAISGLGLLLSMVVGATAPNPPTDGTDTASPTKFIQHMDEPAQALQRLAANVTARPGATPK